MKRIGVLTSGGDAPGMNAAIRSVVRSGIYNGLEVFGIKRGYEGLIDGEFEEMSISSVSDIIQRGGTILRTARSERFMTDIGFKRALDMLENFKMDGLVLIGGDGTYRGGLELSRAGVPVIGIPGTIDNDLPYTEFTIGFDTAVNTVLYAIGNIRDTSASHERTTVIEVMGRNCGDIALHAGLAGGAEAILVPEKEVDIADICMQIIQGRNRGRLHSIIIKAEGIPISSQELVDTIEERTGADTKLVVLGYIQRGGSPTARDRILASLMGDRAVQLLKNGMINRLVGVQGSEIFDFDIEEALKAERVFDERIMDLAKILSI
ncbi:MAG: 6-phosphofructokinase [Eubacteriales bacterium]